MSDESEDKCGTEYSSVTDLAGDRARFQVAVEDSVRDVYTKVFTDRHGR